METIMKTMFEVRFWATTILLLSVIVLLFAYPKMRGKGLLILFSSLSLVTIVGFKIQRYLLSSGILTRSDSSRPFITLVFYISSIAATACLLGYVISIKENTKMAKGQDNSETINSASSEQGGFAIYERYLNNERELQAVKNGFSWPAFFFGAIWAWTNGMVGVGFALLFLAIFLNILGNTLIVSSIGMGGVFIYLLISIGVLIWVGSSGNTWRKTSFEKKGYKLVKGCVSASSPSEAIQVYNEKKG